MRLHALGTVLCLTVAACLSEPLDTTAYNANHLREPNGHDKPAHGGHPRRTAIPSKHAPAP